MEIKKLLEISITKTLRFNLHYFGLGGVKLPVLIARNMRLHTLKGTVDLTKVSPGCVRLGFSSVGIFDHHSSRGVWEVSGKVSFEGEASFGQGARISVGKDGNLEVGEGFRNMAEGQFVSHCRMRLGAKSLISWDTLFMDTDFHSIDDKPVKAPVIIGDNVWVGCRCTVLKGAIIPDGSVVAADSTITKSLSPSHSLFGGVNKLLKEAITWHE